MASTIDQGFVTLYNEEVKLAYQRSGPQLREFVRTRNVMDGDTLVFQKLSSASANQKARNGDVVDMNPTHSTVSVTTSDWFSPIYLDKLDEIKTSANFRAEYAKTSAMALGRKHDEIITDVWNASNTTVLADQAALNSATVLSVLETLREADVEDDELFFIISPAAYTDLMGVTQFASADYVTENRFDGKRKRFNWLGFDFLVYNGLPTNTTGATTTRRCFAGAKSATGFGINSDIKVDIDWVPQKASNLINGSMSVGAVMVDSNGLIEVPVIE